jgi:bacteriocin-like protein
MAKKDVKKKASKVKDIPSKKKKTVRELSESELEKVSGGMRRQRGDEVVQQKGHVGDY